MPFSYDYYPSGYGSIPTILLVCAILGLILGIVLLAVFLPASKRGRYFGATRWLYDFLNFNSFWITTLLKIINIIIITVGVLGGFICLFIYPLFGLILFAGVIVYRIALELIMVMLSIQNNVSSIDDKLSRLCGTANETPIVAPPYNGAQPYSGAQPVQNAACPSCGNLNPPGSKFCMRCGRQLF